MTERRRTSEMDTARTHFLQPRMRRLSRRTPDTYWRFEAIREWVEGRSVLDIGAGRSYKNMHRQLSEVATSLIAIDLDQSRVDEMNAAGFTAVCSDAQGFVLNEEVDVVFAGELIEHLECFTGFFDSVREVLRPGGVLVLTTPNVFKVSRFAYRLGHRAAPVNPDHTVWFCESTLAQLCDRMSYDVVSSEFAHGDPSTLPRRLFGALLRTLLPPRLTAPTIVLVARPR